MARFAITLAEGASICPRDLPAPFNPPGTGETAGPGDTERHAVEHALRQSGWNVSLAAQRLGISRATMHRRIVALGLRRDTGA